MIDFIISLIERDAKFSYKVYTDYVTGDMVKMIAFNNNAKFPHCTRPIMFVNDFKVENYIIRNLKFDDQNWNSLEDEMKRAAGLDKNPFIDLDCPVFATYSSLRELVEDGWKPNHDRDFD